VSASIMPHLAKYSTRAYPAVPANVPSWLFKQEHPVPSCRDVGSAPNLKKRPPRDGVRRDQKQSLRDMGAWAEAVGNIEPGGAMGDAGAGLEW
jgi:hypothetical protein